MKKIGIVVPVYNVGMYLERCITSVLNQTYKNIELGKYVMIMKKEMEECM